MAIFGFSRIFAQPNHAISHFWLPLKVEEKIERRGYLEISIAILGPGSQMTRDRSAGDRMQPCRAIRERIQRTPQLRIHPCLLVINIYRGEDMPMSSRGFCL